MIAAGLAEVAAGSIAMGLGGYLAARTDAEHYATERATEVRETIEVPERRGGRSLSVPTIWVKIRSRTVVKAIRGDQKRWVDFMMKFELGLEEPDPKRGTPQCIDDRGFLYRRRHDSLVSVFFCLLGSLGPDGFGGGDAFCPLCVRLCQGLLHRKEADPRRSWQTLVVGGLAAGAAFFLAKLVGPVG